MFCVSDDVSTSSVVIDKHAHDHVYKEKRWKKSKWGRSLVSNFRQDHVWFSVLLRHPRDRVTSKQRLGVVFALIVTVMVHTLLIL